MSDELVLYDERDRIAVLTLNHPQRRNVLSRAMLTALKRQFDRAGNDHNVRCVVVRAAGSAFSAGHDLRDIMTATDEERQALFHLCTSVMETIRALPKPVIAEVQGIATAAGCQLAATCDLVVASERASFATPGVKIGLFCTTPAVALSRAVPAKKAMEMLLTGAPISAVEAEHIGLVNRVVPHDELSAATMALAAQVTAVSGSAMALGKPAFYEQLGLDYASAYQLCERIMIENSRATDAQEGMQAFLDKRPPDWEKA